MCAFVTESLSSAFITPSILRDILFDQSHTVSQEIASLFIKELGLYPLGVVVQLISGETGVVVKAGDKADTLTLQVCYKSGQGDLRRPIQRNTSLDGNKVRKMLLSDRQIKQLLCDHFF